MTGVQHSSTAAAASSQPPSQSAKLVPVEVNGQVIEVPDYATVRHHTLALLLLLLLGAFSWDGVQGGTRQRGPRNYGMSVVSVCADAAFLPCMMRVGDNVVMPCLCPI